MQLVLRNIKSSKSSKKPDTVHIHACLTPDGSRSYRLDGRLITAKDLKQRLGRLGIHLGTPFSLIRQESVTEVADASDPLVVSAVVAECSGLRTWVQEATAARTELQLQAKDYETMQSKMNILVNKISAAHSDATLGERCALLEAELHEAVQHCTAAVHIARETVQQQRIVAQDAYQTTQTNQLNQREEESRLKQKLSQLHEEHADGPTQNHRDDAEMLEKAIERAALIEQIAFSKSQLETQLASVAACRAAREKENEVQQSHSIVLREIQSLETALNALSEATVGVELAHEAKRELLRVEAQLKEACQAAAIADAAFQQIQKEVKKALDTHNSAVSNLNLHSRPSTHALPNTIAMDLSVLAARGAELRCTEHALAASIQNGVPGFQKPLPSGLVSLSNCFQFKDARVAENFGAALAVLAGNRLGICIAKTSQEAARIVASGQARGLRIWSCDTMSVPDRLKVHRKVATAFPTGSVIAPMDLLNYEQEYEGPIARAFTSHLIVSNMDVGKTVLERYGISSISLDGTIISRGRLTGGWKSSKKEGDGAMQSKIKLDAREMDQTAVRIELQRMEVTEVSLKREMAAWQDYQSAKETAEGAASDLDKFKAELFKAEESLRNSKRAVDRYQAEYSMKQGIAETMDQAIKNCQSGELPAKQANVLRSEISRLKNDAQMLETELGKVSIEAQAAQVQANRFESRCSLERTLKEQTNKLRSLELELETLKQANAKQKNDIEVRRHNALVQCEQELSRATQAHKEAAAELDRVTRELNSLDQLVSELDNIEEDIGITNKSNSSVPAQQLYADFNAVMDNVRSSAARCTNLKIEINRCKARGVTAGSALSSHHTATIAEEKLKILRNHSETIQCGAQRLEEGLHEIEPHAERCNECIFDTVAAFFHQLIGQVLPGLEIEVARVKGSVHIDGTVFKYRRQGEVAWVQGLDALSGGQRTLVSLAFIVASRVVGGGTSSSSVLLADEVDAALDSVNQEQAAKLLRLLCTRSNNDETFDGENMAENHRPALAQVLCISHSPIFQQLCDKIVKLQRNDHGATLA